MPWCPKCRNEYVEGMTQCADCSCALVDSADELSRAVLMQGEAGKLQELVRFLMANQIRSVRLEDTENPEEKQVTVEEAELARAGRYRNVFLQEWAREHPEEWKETVGTEEIPEGTETEDGQEENESRSAQGNLSRSGVYEDASQKAESFRSGAWVLILVGAAGLVLLALILAGILPLRLTGLSGALSGLVMGALFLVFFISGLSSLKTSRRLEEKAREESDLRRELLRWCRENLSAETVDESIRDLPASEEERYFKRTERIGGLIAQNFLNLEEGWLEGLVDEIYTELFDETKNA